MIAYVFQNYPEKSAFQLCYNFTRETEKFTREICYPLEKLPAF